MTPTQQASPKANVDSYPDQSEPRLPVLASLEKTFSPLARAARNTEYLAIWTVRLLLVTVLVTSAIVWRRRSSDPEK